MHILLWVYGGLTAIGLFGWFCTEEFEVFLSVSPAALVYWPMYWLNRWQTARNYAERAAEQQLNDDYRETLRLIEWKPRELTPVELLAEELELERVYE